MRARDARMLNGNDPINLTLTLELWREVYRILSNDHGWKTHLREIEKRCRKNETTLRFTVAQTWTMSSTIRTVNPELADEIRRQLNVQCSAIW